MTEPTIGRNQLRHLFALGVVVTAVVVTLALVFGQPGDRDPERAAVSRTTSTQPTSTTPMATTPAVFPSAACQPEALADGSNLGLAIPRAARLSRPGPEQSAFTAAVGCLTAIGGRPPTLRTQMPIDILRQNAPDADEAAELPAFARLLMTHHTSGIVSILSHDFSRCGRDGVPAASLRSSLEPGQALAPCEYPTPALYRQLFTEIAGAVARDAPGARIRFTAWNEPDLGVFTLKAALGQNGAAREAGRYWAEGAKVVGVDNMLAGEFADRDLPTLLQLRTAFLEGTGDLKPTAWALHPYRDLTNAGGPTTLDGFAQAVAPAPVWATEVTPRLSGDGGIGGDAAAQLARGQELRTELAQRPLRVALYLLLPPPPPATKSADHWDTALADRQGRARPFICGLAGLPDTDCPGDPATYGG